MFEYKATIARVIDGDSIDVIADVGFRVSVAVPTRVMGIDTPEISTAEGRAIRDLLREKLPVGSSVTITTKKLPGDKYGRWLAKIETPFGDLSDWLIAGGMAKVYDGGPKV